MIEEPKLNWDTAKQREEEFLSRLREPEPMGVGVGLGMNGTTLDAMPAESSDGGGVSIPDVYIVIDGEVRQADILTANGHRAI